MHFVCPQCRGELLDERERASRYECGECGREYPVFLGIADFRLEPDPWITADDDRRKAERLAAAAGELSFDELVRLYWEITPGTPAPVAARFISFVQSAEKRSRQWLETIAGLNGASAPGGVWLEIGCGTGDLLVAARRAGHAIVGVDVALRWLIVARRRLAEAGVDATLVCANAEHLPFAASSFSSVLSLGTLEHCRRADSAIAEARRVLRPGGVMRLRTVNRYALTREPHVGVWGVGFVPRRWADAYVRWRSGQRYLHHRPLARGELRRTLRRAGFDDVQLSAAPLLGAEQERLGVRPWIAEAYTVARRIPGVRAGLSCISPLLEAQARAQ